MDFATVFQLAVGLAIIGLLLASLRRLLGWSRCRWRRWQLDRAGATARGRVTSVEPLQRQVNGAAGHPVTVRYEDRLAQREFRETSGLGGYLPREGDDVTVRFLPGHPDQVRVAEIIAPAGAYPVPPGRPADRAGVAWAGVALGQAVVLGAGLLYLVSRPESLQDLLPDIIPPAFVVVGASLVVLGAGRGVAALLRRRRLGAEADGEVTEVWTERGGGSGGADVHPFTVRFTAQDGRQVHARHRTATRRFCPIPGQRVRVRYDPAHPVRFGVRELGWSATLPHALPYLLGVVPLVLGLLWLGDNPWAR